VALRNWVRNKTDQTDRPRHTENDDETQRQAIRQQKVWHREREGGNGNPTGVSRLSQRREESHPEGWAGRGGWAGRR
jgi:hypothetical protein